QGSPTPVRVASSPGLSVGGFDEAAGLSLKEHLTRHTGAPADEDIIQTVAVHVSNGQRRALAGQHVGQEGLDGVIDEAAGLVFVPDGWDLPEYSGCGMRDAGRVAAAKTTHLASRISHPVLLAQRHHAVRVEAGE